MSKGILFSEIGEEITSFLFIKSASRGVASNGKPFLTVFLQDKSGEIEAKLWDINDEQERIYAAETIVKVRGEVQTYRGKKQLRVKQIRPANPEDGYTVNDFLETAPIPAEDMLKTIYDYTEDIKNDKIKEITLHLLKKHEENFKLYPAAMRNHHEFISGLAYHVVSMLKIAKSLADLYPSLDRDLLYSGIILHDLGKVAELSGPISTVYTVEGNLLGHISLISNEIALAAKELNIEGEEITVLQHIILSHHGKLEWGSPKVPSIMEAEIIHFIDNIDARMNMLSRTLEQTNPGEFSERIFPMENRAFYKPIFNSDK